MDDQFSAPTRQGAARVKDPASLIVGVIDAMDPLHWRVDDVNPAVSYAMIEPKDIARWISRFNLEGSSRSDVLSLLLSLPGQRMLGDGFVLAGIADMVDQTTSAKGNTIVLWKSS